MMMRKPPKFSKKDQQKRFASDARLMEITGLGYGLEQFNGVWRIAKKKTRRG